MSYTQPNSLKLCVMAFMVLVAPTACSKPDDAGEGRHVELAPPVAFDSGTVLLKTDSDTLELSVEIARTNQQRSYGLMEREHLDEDAGMLFVYPNQQDGDVGFWMFRTLIPLDIAFIDREGKIVAIRQMEPCPSPNPQVCPIYSPGKPYLTALEVNRGYFADRNIDVGDRVVLVEEEPGH